MGLIKPVSCNKEQVLNWLDLHRPHNLINTHRHGTDHDHSHSAHHRRGRSEGHHRDSNSRPSAHEADDLPSELPRHSIIEINVLVRARVGVEYKCIQFCNWN